MNRLFFVSTQYYQWCSISTTPDKIPPTMFLHVPQQWWHTIGMKKMYSHTFISQNFQRFLFREEGWDKRLLLPRKRNQPLIVWYDVIGLTSWFKMD